MTDNKAESKYVAKKCTVCGAVNVVGGDSPAEQACAACGGHSFKSLGNAVLGTAGSKSRKRKASPKAGNRMKKLKPALQKAGRGFVKVLGAVLDILFLIPGMGLVAYGISMIYIPAGFITAGLCLSALAFFIAKKQAAKRGR